MENIEDLKRRNQLLEEQVRSLQESIGKWKRKAKGAAGNFTYVSERHERGQHFISVPVSDLPADLSLHEVQLYVRDKVIPQFYPYKYHNLYTSRRSGGWVVTLVRPDNEIDMNTGWE